MNVLAISGSLRRVSSNTSLLRATALLAPADMAITLFDGLADIPPFNPDMEGMEPLSVLEFRAQLQQAAGVLISSPEYAHGVPGVLKNALDWLVGSGEFVGKPVALLSASPWSVHAQASLAETLRTMDARVVSTASVAVPLRGRNLDAAGIVADSEFGPPLRAALEAFAAAIKGC